MIHKTITKNYESQNNHEKKNGPTKYPREKFRTHETPTRKTWTHKIHRGKSFGPMKYPRMHDVTMALNSQDPQ